MYIPSSLNERIEKEKEKIEQAKITIRLIQEAQVLRNEYRLY